MKQWIFIWQEMMKKDSTLLEFIDLFVNMVSQ